MFFTNAHVCTAAATTIAGTVTTPISITCPKCATKKDGKRTCCGRGGSWFQNCGDPGDSKFDHTWFQGIQACKDSASGAAQEQAMLSNQTTASQQNTIGSAPSSVKNVYGTHTVNSRAYDKLSNICTSISLFLSTLLLYI